MTEYWKSTPNYWCKFCKVYVKDTKFERQNHEATARHQGSIQKSLRDLHRAKDRDEREKKKAKDEVARLNGMIGGAGPLKSIPSKPVSVVVTKPQPKQATAEDRKRQMAQLMAMGVAIPDEYRKELAMPGDWQAVSVRRTEEKEEKDPKEPVSRGKKHAREPKEDEVEEEELLMTKKPKKSWSSQSKSMRPDVDFSEMLALPAPKKEEDGETMEKPDIMEEDEEVGPAEAISDTAPAKVEDRVEEPQVPVVFKKRKAKPIRDK